MRGLGQGEHAVSLVQTTVHAAAPDDNVVVTAVTGAAQAAVRAVLPALPAWGEVPTSSSARSSRLLYGHDLRWNNTVAMVIFAAVIMLPLGGYLLDRKGNRPFASRPHSWWGSMLLYVSYVIWVPAIFSKDFSFNIGFIVPLVGKRIGITQDEHHGYAEGPIHESTRTMVRLLWHNGCKTGAVLVAIYAFAVPILKLMLLATAESMRCSKLTARRRACRNLIVAMRLISKWAAPDMFAYLLLYYLIRNLGRPPINSLAIFDLGFTCYSVFTLTSALSSLSIPLPHVDAMDKTLHPPIIVRWLGVGGVFFAVALLTAAWVVVFAVALPQPRFSLALNSALLSDHVSPGMREVLKVVNLEDLVPVQHVSLLTAMRGLGVWFRQDRDLNLLLGFIMLLVFALIFTALDMACLLLAALRLRAGARAREPPAVAAARAAHALRHLSMLDVFIMGVIVCALAGGTYRSQGLDLRALPKGLGLLTVSEALHYLCYYLVMTTAHFRAPARLGPGPAKG